MSNFFSYVYEYLWNVTDKYLLIIILVKTIKKKNNKKNSHVVANIVSR